ncbi:hypothetical protein CDL12_14092 [Handroanthus impetiginosus]|uniref:Uncharacterized protein n=1 Tax=Handroanthus impetiginosus TaxID=429701 RepID=A0A2G9H6Y8_9LAMI|nr:hypothetical protein CDL12_14092 [Handroanthus impetiginosus]
MEGSALSRPTNLTTLTSKCHPQFLNFTSPTTFLNPTNKPIPLFLTHCSTKPSTNKQTTTNENPSSIPNPVVQSKPTTLSSSSSSFSRGLIFDLGPKNSWDSLEIGSPVVKRYISDDEERWYMWYHGRSTENPNFDSIGLAVSSNGVHWDRGGGAVEPNSDVGLVMSSSKDWWAFDTHGIRPSEVVIMSSTKVRANSAVYWLYYTGFCSEKIDSLDKNERINLKSLPGLAMSQDGRHWARIEGEHHSGALLDVGSNGEWDSSFIASPQVVFHGRGDLRMFYHSFDVENGQFAVGIARSRDGMRWVKLGKILSSGDKVGFDEFGIVNPCVMRNRKDGKYVMVYEGVGANGKRSIGIAVSSDGLKDWKRVDYNPVLEQSEDCGWDSEGVGMPCLVEMDGDTEDCWRLYYTGIGKEGRSGIGLAVSKGSELKNFERWVGFHL